MSSGSEGAIGKADGNVSAGVDCAVGSVLEGVPGGVESMAKGGDGNGLSWFEEMEAEAEAVLEDSPLRVFGYAGRIGRLAALALSRGSRYIAYSSDVGEAFRPVVDPKYIRIGYGVAITYVCTDIALYTHRAYEQGKDTTRAFIHQTTFQTLASLALPSLVIHQGVHLSQKAFTKMGRFQRYGPVVTGLLMIPLMPPLVSYCVFSQKQLLHDFCCSG
uniref:Mitochondrial fission process protein 1 n=1 Tax=Mucochytrium quahogii TaxID=96639 RepID=A0A7S2S404_9STRA|mmetsp:Transcript_24434/g.52938  ORF Transcript_24434/g.52938 Transcript_24434/m.52938 type:complete len:217 (+) Transcript_24434:128-778(+)